jgi:thymidylate synthase ThyX
VRLKIEAQQIVPTLLKYADHSAYREETNTSINDLAKEVLCRPASSSLDVEASSVTLVSTDPNADDTLVAAILYPHQSLAMRDLRQCVAGMDAAAKERVVDEYLKRRGRHDTPGRALEHITCTVEMTMDYGAYRDIQRHRMASQALQPLSPLLGFSAPREMERFGYGDRYEELMARAADAYHQIADAGLPCEAAYVLPLATNVRALFTWNLREAAHFIELRSARQGHPSYRKVAQDVYRVIAQAHPLIAKYLRPNLNDYALTRD